MRQRDGDEFIDRVAEQDAELANTLGVRAIAAPHGHATAVEPDDIAAFEPPGLFDVARHVHAQPPKRLALYSRLRGTLPLAHVRQDRPCGALCRRITCIDGVERDP